MNHHIKIYVAILYCAALTGCMGIKTPEKARMTSSRFRHGFRYDPMEFVKNDRTVEGAKVRTFVFNQPLDGDAELIEQAVNDIFAEQREDGSMGDINDTAHTAWPLMRALRWGCDQERPAVGSAVESLMEREREEDGTYGIYGIMAACLTGREDADRDGLASSVTALADEFTGRFWDGCPATPGIQLRALWSGRHLAEVDWAFDKALAWVSESISPAGCVPGRFGVEFIACALTIDHPACREIMLKSVPLVLRSQMPDGGWGADSMLIFEALKKFELLEELRGLPPLPPDWQIARSLPVEPGELRSLHFKDGMLWTCNRTTPALLALSPEDGREVGRMWLPGPEIRGIEGRDDAFVLVQEEPPYALHTINLENGAILHSVLGHDAYSEGVNGAFSGGADKKIGVLWDAEADLMSQNGDTAWFTAGFPRMLFKIDRSQDVLDWGEDPIAAGSAGIAWDGEHLWVLDNANNRICMLVKTAHAED